MRKDHTAIVTAGDIPLTTPAKKKKTVKQIANEIVMGTCSDPRWKTWGVGAVRKKKKKKAGYDFKAVQKEVNKIMR